jgi:hypothetical protein
LDYVRIDGNFRIKHKIEFEIADWFNTYKNTEKEHELWKEMRVMFGDKNTTVRMIPSVNLVPLS